jgi:hypothetical protein
MFFFAVWIVNTLEREAVILVRVVVAYSVFIRASCKLGIALLRPPLNWLEWAESLIMGCRFWMQHADRRYMCICICA